MNVNKLKKQAALAAVTYVKPGEIIGVGTGSTANCFIRALAEQEVQVEGAVASSTATAKLLQEHGIPLLNLNDVGTLPLYVDGADEINANLQMIKGGGGALTREKIIASNSDKFVCIASKNKKVNVLGKFPLPIEVMPIARSFVARELVKLGGRPAYRQGFVTDNGNVILDVVNLSLIEPLELEKTLNNIPGVIANGIFAARPADILLLATEKEVQTVTIG